MTSFALSIIVALLGFGFARIVYHDYRRGVAPKWLSIPIMTLSIILAIAALVVGMTGI